MSWPTGEILPPLTCVARAEWTITLDGDGQNNPVDIPRLQTLVHWNDRAHNLQLATGLRRCRQENILRHLSSRVPNRSRAMNHTLLLIIGFIGQAFFSMRFVVQWLYSERQRRILMPTAFWYFSLVGGCILLSYAIYKRDPVFIAGQAMGLFI
jgi:lipid-A-disaccharide synthase-like uncharacterized protein